MRLTGLSWLICLLVLRPHAGAAQEPQRLTRPDITPAVWGVLETPHTVGPHPAVIILPGSAGWRPAYAQLARAFADSGFAALALDYYAVSGRDSSREDAIRKRPQWQETIRNAVVYLEASPPVSGRGIALVGYSRGAFLAVSVASSLPAVRAVVDYFGGGNADPDSLAREVRHFPPLLILHGEADTAVPASSAQRLRDGVLAHGGEVEMHLYPGAQHGFNAEFSPGYSERDASDSWRRTIEFLRARLAN